MSSYPNCSWPASVCTFVEVDVIRHNTWMFFRVRGFVPLVPIQAALHAALVYSDFELCFSFYLHLLSELFAVTPVSEHCLSFSPALEISFPCQITTIFCRFWFSKSLALNLFPYTPVHKPWSGTQPVPCKLTNQFFSTRSDSQFSEFFFYSFKKLFLVRSTFPWNAGLGPQISVVWNIIVIFAWVNGNLSKISVMYCHKNEAIFCLSSLWLPPTAASTIWAHFHCHPHFQSVLER